MTMTLYIGTPAVSSWSMRPYLALAEAGAQFAVTTIDLDRSDTATQLQAISPTGRVPVLTHEDLVLPDSLAICEYAAELFPEALLWPTDRATRARARAVSCEMHAGFTALRRDMPMNLLEDRHGHGQTLEAAADIRRVHQLWHVALAASGGPYLFGAFSIADAMFAPVATRFTTYGVELDATCRAYVAALAALPAMVRWRAVARGTASDLSTLSANA